MAHSTSTRRSKRRTPSNVRVDAPEQPHETLNQLVKMLRQRRLIVVVGAGDSAGAGYPTWRMLLTRLHRTLTNLPMPPEGPKYVYRLARMDSLWRAQEYRRLLGDAGLSAVLWDVFKPNGKQPPSVLSVLARLPFRHYLTTNYDNTLEAALIATGKKVKIIEWNDTASVANVLRGLSNVKGDKYLLYLHGRYSSPEHIVLAESDYLRRYVLNDDAPRKLSAIFMTQPVLFVGFSLNDPDVMYILRAVQGHLAAETPQHFALLPRRASDVFEARAEANYYIKRYGITPIYYPAANKHAGLEEILKQVELALPPGTRPAWNTELHRPQPKVDPDDPVKGKFGGRSTMKGWQLVATVEPTDRKDLFWMEIRVEAPKGFKQERWVRFTLHPTFTPDWARVKLKDGWARLERTAYGAFTVGASVEGTDIKLELDLATVPSAPATFRAN